MERPVCCCQENWWLSLPHQEVRNNACKSCSYWQTYLISWLQSPSLDLEIQEQNSVPSRTLYCPVIFHVTREYTSMIVLRWPQLLTWYLLTFHRTALLMNPITTYLLRLILCVLRCPILNYSSELHTSAVNLAWPLMRIVIWDFPWWRWWLAHQHCIWGFFCEEYPALSNESGLISRLRFTQSCWLCDIPVYTSDLVNFFCGWVRVLYVG